jgi:RimJ/RimL family protein N-acetyltransferase
LPRTTDLAAIRAALEADRPWAAYALGDLTPRHFARGQWHLAEGPAPGLVLLYRGSFASPVLFALGEPAAVGPLLDELGDEPEMHLHVRPEVRDLFARRYRILHEATMWRMVLGRDPRLPTPPPEIVRLGPSDLPALRELYADGEPAGEAPDFFDPAMLDDGAYFGVREGDRLIAAAGTHLVTPEESIAAAGNVYTRRDRRGRGLATFCTGAVTAEVLRRGVRTIVLSVNRENPAAARVYERLGFARYCTFREGLAILSGPGRPVE